MSINQFAADYQAATREFLSLAKSLKESDFDRSDA